MLNAEQIAEIACGMDELWNAGPGGHWLRPRAGEGPYRLVVADHETEAPYAARLALTAFAGVPIPNLCQLSREMRYGHKTLHVVPQLVYDVLTWQEEENFFVDLDLEPARFENPPTEDDMADVLVNAMSVYGPDPGTVGLGLAARTACNRLGWRTVAALVNTIGAESADDVAAALRALIAEPDAPTG